METVNSYKHQQHFSNCDFKSEIRYDKQLKYPMISLVYV